MNRHNRRCADAALMPLVALCLLAAPTSPAMAEPQEKSTAVLTAHVTSRSPSAPLDMRVSVQFVNSKAADVLDVLAKAAGLTVEMPPATLEPVTITLTNVRLRTAIDAICDTASCTWRLEGTTIKVASVERARASALPGTVSIALEQVSVPDVFRAIGAAINVPVTIDGHVERPAVTVKFTNAQTTAVLDHLCKNAGCTWEFDAAARQLRVLFKAP